MPSPSPSPLPLGAWGTEMDEEAGGGDLSSSELLSPHQLTYLPPLKASSPAPAAARRQQAAAARRQESSISSTAGKQHQLDGRKQQQASSSSPTPRSSPPPQSTASRSKGFVVAEEQAGKAIARAVDLEKQAICRTMEDIAKPIIAENTEKYKIDLVGFEALTLGSLPPSFQGLSPHKTVL